MNNYYDEISEGYDELHKDEQLKKIAVIKKELQLKKTDKLLDIGCGPYYGDFDCDVTGIDPSKELLKHIKNPNIKKILGLAESLPFKNNSFDYVISITAIHNFTDISKGLHEAKRVGKKKFVFSYLKRSGKAEEIQKLIEELFVINKTIEEDKDIIIFCEKEN